MPTSIYTLPNNLTATHVIGVTPADHNPLSGTAVPGFHPGDLAGHPQHAFTRRGKIRPTVYFANGARFTQSHSKQNNIGYHPPRGQHKFFGNVDRDEYQRARRDDRAFAALLRSYVNSTPQPCHPMPPALGEPFRGRMLLEIYEGAIHPSRSAIVAVTYQQAAEIIRSLRARSETKLQFDATEEWYFGERENGE